MRNRNDVLNEALCLIDDDLLARALAGRSLPVAGRTKRFVRVFGRQLPAVVASIMAVAVVVVCLAAIPGVIRLMRLLGGMLPERPEPPVAGTVESAEITESAPELLPDSTGALMVNGKLIDCGEHRPMFREYPTDDGYYATALVPVTITLRALGLEVGEVVDGRAEVVFEGKSYVLSIREKRFFKAGDSMGSNLIFGLMGGGLYAEVREDELMLDARVLFGNTLFLLTGGRAESTRWDCDIDFGKGLVRVSVYDHIHNWSPCVPWNDEKHERHCQNMTCEKQVFEMHWWYPAEVTDTAVIYVCEECHVDTVTPFSEIGPTILRTTGVESLTVSSPYDNAAWNQTIDQSNLDRMNAIPKLMRDATYHYAAITPEPTGGGMKMELSMEIRYRDGETAHISIYDGYVCFREQDVYLYWRMDDADVEKLDALFAAE